MESLSSLNQSSSASVHFVVSQVSPIKQSKKKKNVKYFDSKITDGTKVVTAILFDPKLRQAFEKSLTNRCPINLTNCVVKQIQSTNDDQQFEILANNSSKVDDSTKSFSLSNDDFSPPPCQVKLADIIILQMVSKLTSSVKWFDCLNLKTSTSRIKNSHFRASLLQMTLLP